MFIAGYDYARGEVVPYCPHAFTVVVPDGRGTTLEATSSDGEETGATLAGMNQGDRT
jgi:hypothetical protein